MKVNEREADRTFSLRWTSGLLLLASFAVTCCRSSFRELAGDELLTYYTIHQPSLGQLLRFQTSSPIVLEPPAFEALAYLIGKPFHDSAFSLRLVSIFGFLLAQFCLYLLVRRLAGERAAWVGVLLTIVAPVSLFSVLVRPYGLLVGMSMAALYCWQASSWPGTRRGWMLGGLALSLAVATTCQFYGILAWLPVAAGELHRTLRRRRFDLPVLMALAAGPLSILLDLPTWRVTLPFKAHMARDAGLGPRSVLDAYVGLLVPGTRFLGTLLNKMGIMASLCGFLLLLAVLYASWRVVKRLHNGEQLPAWTAFATLTLLPFPCVFFAYNVTHTFAPRHCAECALGFVALLAVACAGTLQKMNTSALALLCLTMALLVAHTTKVEYNERAMARASFRQPAGLMPWLQAHPGQRLYTTVDTCLALSLYGDRALFPYLRCVSSREKELQYTHMQIVGLTAMALGTHTAFPLTMVSFNQMQADLPALYVDDPHPWQQWIAEALKDSGASLQPLDFGPGPQLGGHVFAISR